MVYAPSRLALSWLGGGPGTVKPSAARLEDALLGRQEALSKTGGELAASRDVPSGR